MKIKLFYFVCISLLGCFTTNGQSKSITRADSLFLSEQYEMAALLFEEIAYYEEELVAKSDALLRKAACYKALGDYQKSLSVIKRIGNTRNDSIGSIVGYEIALLEYLSGAYRASHQQLLIMQLRQKSPNEDLIYLEALSLIGMNRWQDAKDLLIKNIDFLGLTSADLSMIFEKKLKPKNPSKAFNLSMLLPGTGQMYAGHFFKGLLSGTIQTGLVGFSVYSLYQGYFFTGAFSGVALFYTFYFGGARYAQKLAIETNIKRSNEMSAKLLRAKKKTLTEGL